MAPFQSLKPHACLKTGWPSSKPTMTKALTATPPVKLATHVPVAPAPADNAFPMFTLGGMANTVPKTAGAKDYPVFPDPDGKVTDRADRDVHLKTPAAAIPDITTSSTNPADWLALIPGALLAFKAHNAGAADGIFFRPLYEVHHQRYSVYWRIHQNQTL